MRTNEYGMRSDPIRPGRIPGTRRIYFLGDSMTYGTTQVDQSRLFTEIVHQRLPEQIHEPVEVMNGAISGWAPANELAYLREHGTLNADLVILVLNSGDPTQPMSPNRTAIASLLSRIIRSSDIKNYGSAASNRYCSRKCAVCIFDHLPGLASGTLAWMWKMIRVSFRRISRFSTKFEAL